MAVVANGIGGFEIGTNPPAGTTTIGYLQQGNGYLVGDLTAGAARSGNWGLNVNTSSQSLHAVWQPVLTNTSLPGGTTAWEARYRFYFRPQSFPAANDLVIASFQNGLTPPTVYIEMNTSGALRIVPAFCGNTTSAYAGSTSLNTWYQVRVQLYGNGSGGQVDATHDSSCLIEIYGDDSGTLIASFADSLNTGENMPTVWPTLIVLGQEATRGPATARQIQYDDLWWKYASDTDVAALEWPRATKIYLIKPNGVGSSTQFSRGGVDSGANWSQVNDVPLVTGGSASDVRTSTVGNTDKYTHESITSGHVVYHIRASGFWSDDSSLAQTLIIDSTEFDSPAINTAQYALADVAYTNAATLSEAAFNALQIGVKKKQGGGTMFVANFFLEVLSGPPPVFEEDLGGSAWEVTPTCAIPSDGAGLQYNDDITFATATLGFRLGNQGVDITVPVTWQIQRIDVGYRDEGTS